MCLIASKALKMTVFKCLICGTVIKDNRNLARHARNSHPRTHFILSSDLFVKKC